MLSTYQERWTLAKVSLVDHNETAVGAGSIWLDGGNRTPSSRQEATATRTTADPLVAL
jgi:hypothetical protein